MNTTYLHPHTTYSTISTQNHLAHRQKIDTIEIHNNYIFSDKINGKLRLNNFPHFKYFPTEHLNPTKDVCEENITGNPQKTFYQSLQIIPLLIDPLLCLFPCLCYLSFSLLSSFTSVPSQFFFFRYYHFFKSPLFVGQSGRPYPLKRIFKGTLKSFCIVLFVGVFPSLGLFVCVSVCLSVFLSGNLSLGLSLSVAYESVFIFLFILFSVSLLPLFGSLFSYFPLSS